MCIGVGGLVPLATVTKQACMIRKPHARTWGVRMHWRRRVRADGGIKVGGKAVFIGSAFEGEMIGLREAGDGLRHVYAGKLRLGVIAHDVPKVIPLAQDLEDG